MSIRQPKDRRQTADSRRQPTTGRRRDGGTGRALSPPLSLSPRLPVSKSVLHICHLSRPETSEELCRAVAFKLRVGRFDKDEEAVARGEREVRRVEDRMVRLW